MISVCCYNLVFFIGTWKGVGKGFFFHDGVGTAFQGVQGVQGPLKFCTVRYNVLSVMLSCMYNPTNLEKRSTEHFQCKHYCTYRLG